MPATIITRVSIVVKCVWIDILVSILDEDEYRGGVTVPLFSDCMLKKSVRPRLQLTA